MSAQPQAVEAHAIGVRLGDRTVLDEVSFSVRGGAVCGLIGPNGAGKTTLLRTLAGLISPQSGTVDYPAAYPAARRFAQLDAPSRAKLIAYLPQERTVHWAIPVERVVALGRLAHRSAGAGESAADRAAIEHALETMAIAHLAKRSIREISGGERARVLMARALAQETPVLLADEPVAGLDLAHALDLFEHLRRLARAGRTIVVALHDLSLAARYADQIVLLKSGRLLAHGAPDVVLDPQTIEAAYDVTVRCGEVDGVPYIVPLKPFRSA